METDYVNEHCDNNLTETQEQIDDETTKMNFLDQFLSTNEETQEEPSSIEHKHIHTYNRTYRYPIKLDLPLYPFVIVACCALFLLLMYLSIFGVKMMSIILCLCCYIYYTNAEPKTKAIIDNKINHIKTTMTLFFINAFHIQIAHKNKTNDIKEQIFIDELQNPLLSI